MNYLFIDTTTNFTLILFDTNFNLVEKVELETQKTSEVIHDEIYKLLSSHSLKLSSDKISIISICGPGSYTGMRISEGLNQILELEGIKVYSFPSFFLAEKSQISWDYWVYPAFKNEVYVLDRSGQSQLVALKEFEEKYLNSSFKLITYGKQFKQFDSILDSKHLIIDQAAILKEVIAKNMRSEPFYFRPVEVEFKQTLK